MNFSANPPINSPMNKGPKPFSFAKTASAGLLFCVMGLATQAHAGVVLKMKSVGQNGQPDTSGVMSVKGTQMRIEQPSSTGKPSVAMIFLPQKKEMHALDSERKLDQVIDAASIKQITAMQNQMEGMMKQAMQNAPPEQQKAMQKMLDDQKNTKAAGKTKPTFKVTQEHETLLGKKCVRWDLYRGAARTRSMWIAPAGSFKGDKEALNGLKAVSLFMEDLMKDLPQGGGINFPFEGLAKMGGLPLKIVSYEGDKVKSIDLIVDVKSKKLKTSLFTAPAGFKRQTLSEQLKNSMPPAGPGARPHGTLGH